jgi:hypothetical protein
MKGEYKTKRILMATTLKPGLTLDDHPDNDFRYLKNELKKIKFEPPSIFNQLKKLFIYLALLFVQEKPGNKKGIADKKELVSSLKNLLSIEQNKLNTYLSEVDKLKLMTLDFVNRRKSERGKSLMKLRGKKVNSEKNEAAELEGAEVHKEAKEMIDILHEITAANPVEHALMLKESYALLKMQPRAVDEPEDEFQDRLLKHTTDAISRASDTEDNVWFKYGDYAYEYLSKYSSHPVMDRADTENENIASMKMSNRKFA